MDPVLRSIKEAQLKACSDLWRSINSELGYYKKKFEEPISNRLRKKIKKYWAMANAQFISLTERISILNKELEVVK